MQLFVLILVMLCSISAFAEENPLDKITSLTCEFPITSVNDWKEETPAPVIKKDQKLVFQLDSIDVAKSTAKIVGKGKAQDLKVITTPESLHFLEEMPSGILNLTTVFNAPTKDGRFKAVHSRHVKIGDPLPSQAYGFCK